MEDHFGKRLQEAMDARGLSAAQLAKKAGVVPSTISRHLERVRPPTRESYQKYEQVLDVILVERPKLPSMTAASASDGLTPNKRVALARLGEEVDWETVPADQYDHIHAGLKAIQFSSGHDADPGWLLAQARRLLREAKGGEMATPPPALVDEGPSPERKAQLAAKKAKRKR